MPRRLLFRNATWHMRAMRILHGSAVIQPGTEPAMLFVLSS
jgi:hypothetical protein